MLINQVRFLSTWERLLYWINERENIRVKRHFNQPPPWTDDEILQKYRFCNVRRMDDKVSQWLLNNWYQPYCGHPNMLAGVAIARFFNLPSSLELLTGFIFRSVSKEPCWSAIRNVLRTAKKSGPVFNGAYMVRGNDGVDKVGSVINQNVKPLWEKHKKQNLIDITSMEQTHANLCACYGMGSFMAGQIVADLRWACVGDWADRHHWAPIGPGSKRGLARLGPEYNLLDTITSLRTQIKNPRLEAIDYQSCLCEFDKYERALWDEGRPKQLYRGGV